MRARVARRLADRTRETAELCGVSLTAWWAMSRKERKAAKKRAKKAAYAGFRVVGSGPFPLPGEWRRLARAKAEARLLIGDQP